MASALGYDGGITAGIGVSDLDKGIAWYQGVLGFEVIYKLDDMGWAELKTETNGVNIGLSTREDRQVAGGGATLTFGVKDIAGARAQLEAQDVRFDGETQVIPGMVSLATFFDPDGNQLMLYQDLSGGAST